MAEAVENWSVNDVCDFLSRLELTSLVPGFQENAVDGKDLLSLTDEDMKELLGCKPLQVRKIRKSLPTLSGPSGAPAVAAAPQASTSVQAATMAAAPAPVAAPAPRSGERAAKEVEVAQLEQAASEMRGKADEVAGQAGACEQAAGLLKQANGKLGGAMQALKGVQVSGVVDMRRDRRSMLLGGAADVGFAGRRMMQHNPGQTMLEMGLVQKANDACKSAAHDIAQAKALLPGMPGIQEASMQSAKGGVFANVLAPGRLGEMAQMAAVKKGMGEVEQMMQQVGQALEWVGRTQQGIGAQAQELRAAAAAKQAEADACKRMMG